MKRYVESGKSYWMWSVSNLRHLTWKPSSLLITPHTTEYENVEHYTGQKFTHNCCIGSFKIL